MNPDPIPALLGASNVLTAREDIIPYAFDGTAALKQLSRAVVFPRTPEEVAAVLKLAREHRIPVVTRGSGTGLSGGSVPVPGALVMCLVRFDRILERDERNLTLLAEAGAVTQDIFAVADAAGLFYPVVSENSNRAEDLAERRGRGEVDEVTSRSRVRMQCHHRVLPSEPDWKVSIIRLKLCSKPCARRAGIHDAFAGPIGGPTGTLKDHALLEVVLPSRVERIGVRLDLERTTDSGVPSMDQPKPAG